MTTRIDPQHPAENPAVWVRFRRAGDDRNLVSDEGHRADFQDVPRAAWAEGVETDGWVQTFTGVMGLWRRRSLVAD